MDDQTVLAWGQPQASLTIRQGAQVGTTFAVVSPEVILGREEGAHITLRDPEASRRHARISWQSGNYYVEDLGSTNGTFLNGTLVSSPQALHSGDTVGIGQTLLVFQMQVGAPLPQATAVSAQPVPPLEAVEPAAPRSGTSRCLLWGCGCLILLGLLLVVLAIVAMIVFAQDIQPIFDELGIPVQLTMLYVAHGLA